MPGLETLATLAGIGNSVGSVVAPMVGSVLGYGSSKYNRQTAQRMNNLNAVMQWQMNERNLDYQNRVFDYQKQLDASNMEYQKYVDSENFKRQDEQFAYQKYLNNNQIQIQSADAQKAGINPIAMNGGSLSSGSYSNVNTSQVNSSAGGNPNQSWSNLSPALSDMSGVISSLSDLGKTLNEKKLAKDQLESNEDIADKNRKSSEDITASNNSTQLKLESMKEQSELIQQLITINHDKEMKKEDREAVAQNILNQLESNEKIAGMNNASKEKIAGNELSENQYQFDVANERAQRQLINQSKSEAIDNLSKAYKEFCRLYGYSYDDQSSGSGTAGTIYSAMRAGVSGIERLTGRNREFWDWYVSRGFNVDTGYHSSVRRR